MLTQVPSQPSSVISPGRVMVTVTTVRFDEPQGEPAWERQSTAEGEFTAAILQVLGERLAPWALHQVAGKVLARRPDDGEPIEYEGLWGDLRHLLILVLPVIDGQVLACDDWPVVEIPDLYLPEPDSPRSLLSPSEGDAPVHIEARQLPPRLRERPQHRADDPRPGHLDRAGKGATGNRCHRTACGGSRKRAA